jgi:hypothetical protein
VIFHNLGLQLRSQPKAVQGWVGLARSSYASGSELAFELPHPAVRPQRFAEPMKGLRSDFGESPTGRHAIGANSNLDDVFTTPAANLVLVVIPRRIPPGDAPSLHGGVPETEGRAIHV